MVIPLEYLIEILENICEPTLNFKMTSSTPVGAPVGTPLHTTTGWLACGFLYYPYGASYLAGYSRVPYGTRVYLRVLSMFFNYPPGNL